MIRESLIASTGPTLLPEFLSIELHADSLNEIEVSPNIISVNDEAWRSLGAFVEQTMTDQSVDVYRRSLVYFDRLLVSQAMKVAKGLQSRAAEILGLSRPTLRAKIRAIESEINGSQSLP